MKELVLKFIGFVNWTSLKEIIKIEVVVFEL